MKPFRILDPNSPERMVRGVCALAVMTKAPQAGRVKTRLVPPLTPEEAAELNKCFLRDTAAAISIACSRRPGGDEGKRDFKPESGASHSEATTGACGIAVYTPVGAESAYTYILPADFSLLPQRGEKFGERLYLAVEDLVQCGFGSVCLIDSDSPTVSAENFTEAVELLSTTEDRVVLGPSDDGGYYLIGVKKPHRHLFEQIDWSTERVLNQTIQRASEMGIEVKLLPTGYDVDDSAGLRRLCNELLTDTTSSDIAPHTRKFLASLVERKKLQASARRGERRMAKWNEMKRALVTGAAGLIGSHIVDLLVREGWQVRALDNLEPQTHRRGKPAWVNSKAEFIEGDMRNRDAITATLDDIDVIFHQAAYGGYMPEIAKYVHVNSLGTAQMLEVIREKNLPIKKIIVASSQAVYSEGAGECPKHGLVFPSVRPIEQLRRGDWQVHCPICGAITKNVPTPENAPIGGETVYGLTKVDQERLVLLWGKQIGIPTVALRYSCTYGPRQSIFNPYTGVIAIFCTRLLNNLPPVLYEDGEQTRDFSFVADVARANLLASQTDKLDGLPVNIGSACGTPIHEIAEQLGDILKIDIAPEVNGEFRPGEMRHLTSDTTLARSAGYKPTVDLSEGILRYIDWIRKQSDIRDYFSEASDILKNKGIVHRVAR